MISTTRVAIALAIATALGAGAWIVHVKGVQAGGQAVQALWDAEKIKTMEAHGEQLLLAHIKQAELTENMERLTNENRTAQNRIAADRDRLLDGLLQRPETRAGVGGVPDGAAPDVGCTGAGLARRDGEFLARYAADAARLQAGFDACQAAYRQAVTLTTPE